MLFKNYLLKNKVEINALKISFFFQYIFIFFLLIKYTYYRFAHE